MLLLDILNLLAHLLDQHLELDGAAGGVGDDGFGGEGVGFAVEFLHQEVEATADGALLGELTTDFADVGVEAVELFVDVGLLGHQGQFGF